MSGSSPNKKTYSARCSWKNTPETSARITSEKKIPLKYYLMACWLCTRKDLRADGISERKLYDNKLVVHMGIQKTLYKIS
jgi:hypothetical protein